MSASLAEYEHTDKCEQSVLIYVIPPTAMIPSEGVTPAKHRGYLPAGLYVEHRQVGCRGDHICLVPLGYPAGEYRSPHYWVREADVINHGRPYVPADHTLPEPGKCFLGLNFEPEDLAVIQDAILTAAAKTTGNGQIEHDLVSICKFYNAAHAKERESPSESLADDVA